MGTSGAEGGGLGSAWGQHWYPELLGGGFGQTLVPRDTPPGYNVHFTSLSLSSSLAFYPKVLDLQALPP